MSNLTLAKAVLISKDANLNDNFKEHFFPELDAYMFFSEASYNTETYSYEGKLLMHDRIVRENNIPDVPLQSMNFICIDFKPSDRKHTYLTYNKKCLPITDNQKEKIAKMFNATYY